MLEIVITLLLLIIIFLIVRKYCMNRKHIDLQHRRNELIRYDDNYLFPDITIIENNEIIPIEKNKIVDIEIKNAISMFDNVAPQAILMKNNAKVANELLNHNRTFLSTSKKDFENMMKVKNSPNEFYGTQKVGNKFSKQTKFKTEDKQIKAYGKNAITNAGFNVATMVVGQYYMSEINDKLKQMNEMLKDISSFQNSEYQSKVLHIVSKLGEIIDNKKETLSNEEARKNAYHDNKELETKCSELLGQANIQIKNKLIKEELNFKDYEMRTNEINEWFIYQQLLQELLMKIGDLRYVLAKGSETSRQTHKQYNNYLQQTFSVNKELEEWHNKYINKFGIDTNKQRKKGSLFTIREYTVGLINEDWSYKKIKGNVIQQIAIQTQPQEFSIYEKDKQDEKITILKHNGEYYNLLNSK